MGPDSDDGDLLKSELATLFTLTETSRIRHENDPDRSEGPRMYLAGCESFYFVRVRHDVTEETAAAINALVADEPPLSNPVAMLSSNGRNTTILAIRAFVLTSGS